MVNSQTALNLLSLTACIPGIGSNCWTPQVVERAERIESGDARFISKGAEAPWDGVKTSLINSTAFEWWYFDANSRTGDEGIGVWFLNSNPAGFGMDFPHPSFFIFHARFKDGSGVDSVIPAEKSIISTVGEGSSGLWVGTGSGWTGTPDLTKFSVFFDVADQGIHGVIDFVSTAEARSAVRLASDRNAELMNVGGMGWAISAPAARSVAHVEVAGKNVSFTDGTAYHDHNWGNALPNWYNWYAIRGEVGPYVWTAIESYKGPGQEPFTNAWLTRDGDVILASFDTRSLTIRPWGNGAQYPPTGFEPQPMGAIISFDAGMAGKYEFNLTSHGESPGLNIAKGLAKWFGRVSGGKMGEDLYEGSGMFEWLDLAI